MPHILIVEDDAELAVLITQYLSEHGFELSHAASGEQGARRILAERPDLVILDLMLPELGGLDVCRRVRRDYDGPIMMLTASQSEADHVAGLELGADDFVIKPIEPRVLLARVRSLWRRFEPSARPSTLEPEDALELGPLSFDLVARQVCCSGDTVPLTTMEFDVLRLLAEHAGDAVTRDELYERVCGIPYDGLDRGMDVHVSRIRRKLEHLGFDPSRLKAIRGSGYMLALR